MQSKLFLQSNEPELTLLGNRLAWGGEVPFGLNANDRRQHTYVIGKSGSGKSTLLRNVFLQHIQAGDGAGIIDPHGDLATELLDHIPPHRIDDVVYFNAADREFPISFNFFAGSTIENRNRIASGIVGAFKNVWRESFGPRMEYILSAAISALLECQNTSILGLPRMLVDADYRDWVIRQVKDPVVHAYWTKEFAEYEPRFLKEAISPVQNKVGALLMSPVIRSLIGQVKCKVDIRYVMDNRRIFIANLSKGIIGEDKANLLGALLVNQFQNAAMARAELREEARNDFHLLVDEFHNFTTDSFATILSEARKYRLSLTLAHQYIDQMPEAITRAVFGNVGTMIAFRTGEKDAEIISNEFGGHYDPTLYSSLANGEVVVKLLANGRYGDPFIGKTFAPMHTNHGRSQTIINRSRQRYAAPRQVVEDKIRRWMNGTQNKIGANLWK